MSPSVTAEQERSATTDDAQYTTHREPPHVGGKRYVRCEGCERELLVSLGGRDKLVHRDDCPNNSREA